MTDVHLRRVRYALAVADCRSFTHGATNVHVSQQGLSQQVRLLERELGFDLFVRTTRSVTVTPGGAAYLAVARRALRDLDNAARDARALQSRRTLRIGFLPGAALELTDPILDDFAAAWPAVDVELIDHDLDDSSAGLRDGSTDVAFLRGPLTTDGLTVHELAVEPRVVAVASTHRLAKLEDLTAADLAGVPLVGAPSSDPVFAGFWALSDELGTSGPAVVREASSLTEELQIVARGDAVSVTAMATSRFLQWPGVAYRRLRDCAPSSICVGRRIADQRPEVLGFLLSASASAERLSTVVGQIAEAEIRQALA